MSHANSSLAIEEVVEEVQQMNEDSYPHTARHLSISGNVTHVYPVNNRVIRVTGNITVSF